MVHAIAEVAVFFFTHRPDAISHCQAIVLSAASKTHPEKESEDHSYNQHREEDVQNKKRHEEKQSANQYAGQNGFENGSVHVIDVIQGMTVRMEFYFKKFLKIFYH